MPAFSTSSKATVFFFMAFSRLLRSERYARSVLSAHASKLSAHSWVRREAKYRVHPDHHGAPAEHSSILAHARRGRAQTRQSEFGRQVAVDVQAYTDFDQGRILPSHDHVLLLKTASDGPARGILLAACDIGYTVVRMLQ